MCVFVCVREKERERDKEKEKEKEREGVGGGGGKKERAVLDRCAIACARWLTCLISLDVRAGSQVLRLRNVPDALQDQAHLKRVRFPGPLVRAGAVCGVLSVCVCVCVFILVCACIRHDTRLARWSCSMTKVIAVEEWLSTLKLPVVVGREWWWQANIDGGRNDGER